MRVTNSMLVSNFMNDLNTNMNKLSNLQGQLASGHKYAHVSDDPVAVIFVQQAQQKLNRVADYKSNVEQSLDWLTQSEEGTSALNDMLKKIYESTIDAATDVKSGKDMTNISNVFKEMRNELLQTLNTTFGNKFVYAGYNTTGYTDSGEVVAPFTVNASGNLCYNGVDLTSTAPADLAAIDNMRKDVLTFDVAVGSEMPVTINGIDLVFYGKDPVTGENLNLYNLMDDLYNTVAAGGPADAINDYISDLQAAQDHVLGKTAELGGRVNRLEILGSRYEQDEINYTSMLSDARDADYAEVIMNYKMAEAIYNASLSSGAMIIQPTLMDFLR